MHRPVPCFAVCRIRSDRSLTLEAAPGPSPHGDSGTSGEDRIEICPFVKWAMRLIPQITDPAGIKPLEQGDRFPHATSLKRARLSPDEMSGSTNKRRTGILPFLAWPVSGPEHQKTVDPVTR